MKTLSEAVKDLCVDYGAADVLFQVREFIEDELRWRTDRGELQPDDILCYREILSGIQEAAELYGDVSE